MSRWWGERRAAEPPYPPYPRPTGGEDGKVPVGVTPAGAPVAWDVRRHGPLLVVCGPGSGKTTALRTVVRRCFERPDKWRLCAVDPTGAEFGGPCGLPGVEGADDEESGRELLEDLEAEAGRRYALMADDRGTQPPRIMCIVQEAETFADVPALGRLIRVGGPAGVHLALVSRVPEHLPAALRSNVRVCLALSRVPTPAKGRGTWYEDDRHEEVRVYRTDVEDLLGADRATGGPS